MLKTLALVGALTLATQEPVQEQELVGGYVVGVVETGGQTSMRAAGVASPEHGIPVNTDTVFHIASLSKQITGAALALTILDGKAGLDDPVAQHIPEAAHYGQALTIGHLVYFSSGLTEGYDVPRAGGMPWSTHYHFTVDDAIEASLSVQELQFEPGSQWRYNNINYQLMAEIVERAQGQGFSDFVRQRIFDPLGMSASLIHDDTTTIIPNRAEGVAPRTPSLIEALEGTGLQVAEGDAPILIRRNAPHYGGSGVLTSMEDWLTWQEELLNHQVFGEEFWTLMERRQTYDHPKDNDAMGLVHGSFDEHPALWYSGGDIDASSHMVALPRQGISATCFSNQPGFDCRGEVAKALRARLED